jgi:hypothetical protein
MMTTHTTNTNRRGMCAAAGCGERGRVTDGGLAFCRAHWPEARRRREPEGEPPAVDLHQLYDRGEALDTVNERLVAHGRRPLSAGGFIKCLYEALYPTTFSLEPLRLGERTGGVTPDAPSARLLVFTARLLDAFVVARLSGDGGPARPTDAERDAFLAAPEAVAWLEAWWRARGIDYRVSRPMMALHRKAGRLPAIKVGATEVYHRRDLERLAETIRAAGGWESRAKKAALRPRATQG